ATKKVMFIPGADPADQSKCNSDADLRGATAASERDSRNERPERRDSPAASEARLTRAKRAGGSGGATTAPPSSMRSVGGPGGRDYSAPRLNEDRRAEARGRDRPVPAGFLGCVESAVGCRQQRRGIGPVAWPDSRADARGHRQPRALEDQPL